MKNDNHTRVFGPLSAGCILMLALSACSTSVQGIGSEDSTHGGSGASSSASATSHEKQIVGLTDDNKAGTSRPRSDQKPLDSTKNVKLKDDGSWTVEEDNNGRTESVSVNADGTFQVKNKNSEDSTEEFTLNADGSWEKIEKGSLQIPVAPSIKCNRQAGVMTKFHLTLGDEDFADLRSSPNP